MHNRLYEYKIKRQNKDKIKQKAIKIINKNTVRGKTRVHRDQGLVAIDLTPWS